MKAFSKVSIYIVLGNFIIIYKPNKTVSIKCYTSVNSLGYIDERVSMKVSKIRKFKYILRFIMMFFFMNGCDIT